MKTKRLTKLALLTAAALILFVVELQIPSPVPIPGVKLGLANVVTLFAVYKFKKGEAALLLLARILLGSVFAGSAMTLLYSLCGGGLCLAGMLLLKRVIPEDSMWITSMLGAVLHNVGQIAAAIAVTATPGLILYLPVLLVSGCIAGLFTGLCAGFVAKRNYLSL